MCWGPGGHIGPLVEENGSFGKKRAGEWAKSRKDKTERVAGLGRRTRGDILI